MKKKILFLSFNDFSGGASIAAYNMFKSIPDDKYEKFFYCIKKFSNDKKVKVIKISYLKLIKIFFFILITKFVNFIYLSRFQIKNSLSIFKTKILQDLNIDSFDIVHIHWFFNDFLSLHEMLNIRNKKVIISMHDLWFCNGIHHYESKELNKFSKIIDKYFFKKKINKILKNKDIILTTPSKWAKFFFLNKCKRYNYKEELFKIHIIKNPIKKFKINNKVELRKKYFFPQVENIGLIHFEKKNSYVKGYDSLFAILDKLNIKQTKKYFIIFGNNSNNFPVSKFPNLIFYNFNYVNYYKLSVLYQISDYLILTSRQETFSQLTSESISNNTPVITFEGSGQTELIRHKYNGYIAKNNNIKDFIQGIDFFNNHNKFYNNEVYLSKLYIENYYKNFLEEIYD
jgi:glycosyltransferase involved in cell wall biosynthesis